MSEPRDIPILFSGPMVRAILNGRKTKTRRIIKPQPEERLWEIFRRWPNQQGITRWEVGDRLWVREAHAFVGGGDPGIYITRADYPQSAPSHCENVPDESDVKWRPSIHMPRAYCRITLEVTEVRVEQLQQITEEDAIAEGLTFDPQGGWTADTSNNQLWRATPIEAFAALWATIHKPDGPNGWPANPWVTVTTFQRMTEALPTTSEDGP